MNCFNPSSNTFKFYINKIRLLNFSNLILLLSSRSDENTKTPERRQKEFTGKELLFAIVSYAYCLYWNGILSLENDIDLKLGCSFGKYIIFKYVK